MRTRYGITRGMRNALGRMRLRARCPECEMPIPSYPGARFKFCPHCRAPLFPPAEVESLVHRFLAGEEFNKLMEDWKETTQYEGILQLEPESKEGIAFDRVMRKINAAKLLDQFIGVDVEQEGQVFRLYFSDSARRAMLEQLAEEFKDMTLGVNVVPSETVKGAKWEMVLYQPSSGKAPEGAKGVALDLTGSVPVEQTATSPNQNPGGEPQSWTGGEL